MNKQLITILILTLQCLAFKVYAQEITRPLKVSLEQSQRYLQEREFEQRETRTQREGALTLPFIDDFSRFSLPTNDPDIPVEWQMWEDNSARINNTLCINPPTHGVATLDGLNKDGYPYDFANEFAYGPADTLTSCQIDLGGLTAEDSVKLIFHYQKGGLGNFPEFEDSLVLEMSIVGTNPALWKRIWSSPGGAADDDFTRVIVHISDLSLLHEAAQFRFRNYATLSGNVDHWNLDYIWLDDNIENTAFQIIDVAPSSHETSLLNGLQSMPWDHFQTNPDQFMDDDQFVIFSNLDEDRNISFNAEVYYEGNLEAALPQQSSTAENAFSFLNRQLSINDGTPNSYLYDVNVNDTCANFEVRYINTTSPDINQNNDTLVFTQHFSNYYAYDDGSAEGAYALNQEGSAKAVRFSNQVTDTLLGLLIHFSPFNTDNSNELFVLRAWQEEAGSVGQEIGENFNTYNPQYFSDGFDKFVFYEYDEPLEIPAGNFFAGIIQSTNAELNIGYDVHNNTNTENLFFRLGAGGAFTQSSVQGALMIRPVFKSAKPLDWDFVNIHELDNSNLSLYPNPAVDYINIHTSSNYDLVRIINGTGQVVLEDSATSSSVYVGDLPKGLYLVHQFSNGVLRGITKLVKN